MCWYCSLWIRSRKKTTLHISKFDLNNIVSLEAWFGVWKVYSWTETRLNSPNFEAREMCTSRPVARIFCWGGGGMQVPKPQGQNVQRNGVREIWTTLMVGVNVCERQRRQSVGGSGGMHPQKILKSENLKTPFPATLRPIATLKRFQKLTVIFF